MRIDDDDDDDDDGDDLFVSACLLDTMSPAKTDKPMEMPFVVWTVCGVGKKPRTGLRPGSLYTARGGGGLPAVGIVKRQLFARGSSDATARCR